MAEVRAYMAAHPESELHRRGKMFGVLVCEEGNHLVTLRAFSAMLDGSYHHAGFVPPVYEADGIIGTSREDSRDKQREIFRSYRFLSAKGEEKDLLQIFRSEPRILSVEEYFGPSSGNRPSPSPLLGKTESKENGQSEVMPPSGAGECCAPKLLQEAYLRSLRPLCMAEFWMGAAPKDELRIEGQYYGACSGKCRPILRHMLAGIAVEADPVYSAGRELAEKVEIVYEDEEIIVVNKPAGLLSVPGKDGQYSLLEYLTSNSDSGLTSSSDRAPSPIFPVHRLDQDTSGLIVFAKTQEAAVTLQRYFLRRDIHKLYLAELEPSQQLNVAQQPLNVAQRQLNGSTTATKPSSGLISLPLLPNPFDRPRQMVNHEHGKPAITRYRITDRKGPHGGNIVELYPETGRTHQLRVHCAHPDGLGCPIYGDRLYGSARPAGLVQSVCPDGITQVPSRLMLHAAELTLVHPNPAKGTMTFHAKFL